MVAFILTALASVASKPTILATVTFGLNNPPKFALASTVLLPLAVILAVVSNVASAFRIFSMSAEVENAL